MTYFTNLQSNQYFRLLIYCTLLIIFGFTNVQAQKFKIIKINTSNFPYIDATYEATNSFNEIITISRTEDFKIIENGENREIIKVENPNSKPIPLSIVVMLDVSSSMDGEPAVLSREGVKDLIKQFPLENSELAIGSFRDVVAINTDFTQNKERLLNALESIKSSGSTNFDNAFLLEDIGAVNLVRNGQFKKCILFITDGLSWTSAEKVVKNAKENDVPVFCINVGQKAPEFLKTISVQTGAKYFESVKSIEQFRSINSVILQTMQSAHYGKVFWKSYTNCSNSRATKLIYRNLPDGANYEVPNDKQGILESDPALIMFGVAPPGTVKEGKLDLISKNIPFTNIRLSLTSKVAFHLPDSLVMPFSVETNKTKPITIFYQPKDAGIVSGKLIISSKECPDKSINLTAGNEELVRLLFPKGGEILPTGIDTVIRWEGIKKSRRVQIMIRKEPDSEWENIGEGINLKHQWRILSDTGHHFQVKVTPIPTLDEELALTAKLTGHAKPIRTAVFNRSGNRIVSNDQDGIIKIWDTENGKLSSSLSGFNSKSVFYSNDDNRISSFTNDEILVWDTQSARLINRLTAENKKVYTSFVLPNGNELLLTSNILRDKANTIKLWDPALNFIFFLFSNDLVKSASFSSDGSKAITLDINNVLRIWNTKTNHCIINRSLLPSFTSAISNPNGKTILINESGMFTMLDMDTGAELFHYQGQTYQSFSPSGDLILFKDQNGTTNFMDSYSGKSLLVLDSVIFFHCAQKGYQVLYYKKDTLSMLDAKRNISIFRINNSFIQDASFSPDGTRIIVIRKENEIEFLDPKTGITTDNLSEFDQIIQSASLSQNGKQLLVIMENHSIQVWAPHPKPVTRGATSENFSIISPKPVVKENILFEDQFVFASKELLIHQFIKNPTAFPIRIDKMEVHGTDSSDFEIISNSTPSVLEPFSEKQEEFRFTPRASNKRIGEIRTYTARDTFVTTLIGKGLKKSFDVVSTSVNFGKVKLFQHRDTTLSILHNRGTDLLKISRIESAGPDLEQFTWKNEMKQLTILPNDSFVTTLRFTAKYRGKSTGCLNIWVEGVKEPQPVYLHGEGLAPKQIYVSGTTIRSADSLPVNAKVQCVDLDVDKSIVTVQTNESGKFVIALHADRNYGLSAEKPGYFSNSENLDLSQAILSDTIHKNLYLTELKSGAIIRMNCIFFEFAKVDLLATSQNELYRIAGALKQYQNISVEIQGHTDSIGNESSNMILSTNRANAVQSYLIKKGISPQRMKTKGFGESCPVATNSSEEGRQRNRRVELKISKRN